MSTAKEEVRTLLDTLPDECILENIQYHLYIVDKTQRGIDKGTAEGLLSQEDEEKKFSKWTLN